MTILRPAALGALEATAVQAATSEREFRESYAREIERLEQERRRTWRRFNFLAALVVADAAAPDRDASRVAQRAAAVDELDWIAGDPATATLLEAMTPLADAVHDERRLAEAEAEARTEENVQAEARAEDGFVEATPVSAPAASSAAAPASSAEARAPAILFALAAFEERYEALKGRPFIAQFDRFFAETPLVDF